MPTILAAVALAAAAAAHKPAPAPSPAPVDDLAPEKQAAVLQYDKGDYAEALGTLQQLDNARALDGPLLYRLFFCQKALGHPEDSRKALDRAREALEAEIGKPHALDVPFYLANTYANLGRPQDAKNTAQSATSDVEAGKVAVPKTAIGEFQLGKLYQDQGRQSDAVAHYRKAADGFDLADGRYAGNLRWALRYVGNAALGTNDLPAAESAFAKLATTGTAEGPDWDGLATTRVRMGKYAEASEAWRSSVKFDPANSDDARYAARLAEQAVPLAPLPAKTPGGVAWSAMTQADLESALKEQAAAAKATMGRASEAMKLDPSGSPTVALDSKLREELTGSLKKTRALFVAAGLEYSVRHLGIRETAFREGYAVQIFQERAWELPADPAAGS